MLGHQPTAAELVTQNIIDIKIDYLLIVIELNRRMSYILVRI